MGWYCQLVIMAKNLSLDMFIIEYVMGYLCLWNLFGMDGFGVRSTAWGIKCGFIIDRDDDQIHIYVSQTTKL